MTKDVNASLNNMNERKPNKKCILVVKCFYLKISHVFINKHIFNNVLLSIEYQVTQFKSSIKVFVLNIHYTAWKGNKCHPFNSRRGRLKGPKMYIQYGGLNFIVSSEKYVSCSVLFTSYCLYR